MNSNQLTLFLFIILCCFGSYSCSAKSIEKNIKKGEDVVIRNQSFSSVFDLTQKVNSRFITASRKHGVVKSNVVFIDCMFNGFKAFNQGDDNMTTLEFSKNLIFHHCAFNGNTDMSYIQVNGDFTMLECEVAGQFKISNAWFKGKSASFTSSKFMDKVKAVNCIFNNRVSFLKTEFEQSVSFQKSIFKGRTLMNGIIFHKYAGFDQVIFNHGANFDKTIFKKDAFFDHAAFFVEASFVETCFEKAPSFQHTQLWANTAFDNCKLPEQVELRETTIKTTLPKLKNN